MLKNCGNCKLFVAIDTEKGECGFWKTEINKNDFCIEHQSKELDLNEETQEKNN